VFRCRGFSFFGFSVHAKGKEKKTDKRVDGRRFRRRHAEPVHDARLLRVEDIHVPVPARVARHHGRAVLSAGRHHVRTSREGARDRSEGDFCDHAVITWTCVRARFYRGSRLGPRL